MKDEQTLEIKLLFVLSLITFFFLVFMNIDIENRLKKLEPTITCPECNCKLVDDGCCSKLLEITSVTTMTINKTALIINSSGVFQDENSSNIPIITIIGDEVKVRR